MNFSIGDDGDFVGVSTGTPKALSLLSVNTGGTTATAPAFDWGGLATGALQLGTAAVNTYGAIKAGELQKQQAPQAGGVIPGLDKTQSYLVLGGVGLVAVVMVFSLLRK
jgi:hypothetical protein